MVNNVCYRVRLPAISYTIYKNLGGSVLVCMELTISPCSEPYVSQSHFGWTDTTEGLEVGLRNLYRSIILLMHKG